MAPEPRVLVVDDSVVARHVLVLTLRQLPEFAYATIDQAGNGAIALKKLAAERYDLVLSDVRMPLMDGLDMVSKLRNEMGDRTTPVLLISTLGTEEDVQRGLAAGADAYVLKPLLPHSIQTAIREFLDSRNRPAAAPQGSGQKT
jgi:two-component system chemotaxis response regulator CheY